ncbi:hypothetical protein M0813_00326 [Anaeramoeba flamelloides]|uniref:Uncharacterized protein n=1 Tax=Anaeramoeba flamelloides TaxID=1746091 RepID=A0ABQ8YAS9_9EUKA|nr:hypothetical protein M0813_00326 [Anaeramoeba flamelloides]
MTKKEELCQDFCSICQKIQKRIDALSQGIHSLQISQETSDFLSQLDLILWKFNKIIDEDDNENDRIKFKDFKKRLNELNTQFTIANHSNSKKKLHCNQKDINIEEMFANENDETTLLRLDDQIEDLDLENNYDEDNNQTIDGPCFDSNYGIRIDESFEN